MTSLRRLAFAAAALVPTAAFACPQCAGREGVGVGGVIALGGMILLPFAIVALAWPAIRRGPSRS